MISIAICEDNNIQREILADYLSFYAENKQLELTSRGFSNAEELISHVKDGNSYDVYLLDIVLLGDGMNGIELATTLRYMNDTSAIIFTTSSTEHAIQAFDVEATSYLLKPIDPNKLYKVLDKCVAHKVQESLREMAIKTEDGSTTILKIEQITYVSVTGRRPIYHVITGEEKSGQTMHIPFKDTVNALLETGLFCMGGSSLIVNLTQIDSMDSESLTLKNGEIVYPPKSSITSIKNEWKKYKKA